MKSDESLQRPGFSFPVHFLWFGGYFSRFTNMTLFFLFLKSLFCLIYMVTSKVLEGASYTTVALHVTITRGDLAEVGLRSDGLEPMIQDPGSFQRTT